MHFHTKPIITFLLIFSTSISLCGMDLSKVLEPKLSKYTVGLSIEEEKKGLLPNKVILIYFYKKDENFQFFDNRHFINEIAKQVAINPAETSLEKERIFRPRIKIPKKMTPIIEAPESKITKEINIALHDIEYVPEWTLFGGDTSAKKLSDYLSGQYTRIDFFC
jgi:hypothetical protein